jgi:hypothetical protein
VGCSARSRESRSERLGSRPTLRFSLFLKLQTRSFPARQRTRGRAQSTDPFRRASPSCGVGDDLEGDASTPRIVPRTTSGARTGRWAGPHAGAQRDGVRHASIAISRGKRSSEPRLLACTVRRVAGVGRRRRRTLSRVTLRVPGRRGGPHRPRGDVRGPHRGGAMRRGAGGRIGVRGLRRGSAATVDRASFLGVSGRSGPDRTRTRGRRGGGLRTAGARVMRPRWRRRRCRSAVRWGRQPGAPRPTTRSTAR